jgi:hypothetical protein
MYTIVTIVITLVLDWGIAYFISNNMKEKQLKEIDDMIEAVEKEGKYAGLEKARMTKGMHAAIFYTIVDALVDEKH